MTVAVAQVGLIAALAALHVALYRHERRTRNQQSKGNP